MIVYLGTGEKTSIGHDWSAITLKQLADFNEAHPSHELVVKKFNPSILTHWDRRDIKALMDALEDDDPTYTGTVMMFGKILEPTWEGRGLL